MNESMTCSGRNHTNNAGLAGAAAASWMQVLQGPEKNDVPCHYINHTTYWVQNTHSVVST